LKRSGYLYNTLEQDISVEFDALWKLWLLAVVVFVAGHAWFHKLKGSLADVV
jgi:hypothetical protein